MPTIKYLSPIDQPLKLHRLIDWIETNLNSTDYDDFKCLVAFAKEDPFLKIDQAFQNWKKRSARIAGIFGIDHKGTSWQALDYILKNFDDAFIIHASYSTFHPKIYCFSGNNKASVYIGSNNFTVGGLETNFESGVFLEFDLPAERKEFDKIIQHYNDILKKKLKQKLPVKKLTSTLLSQLKKQGLLLDQRKNSRGTSSKRGNISTSIASIFPPFIATPPRSLPLSVYTGKRSKTSKNNQKILQNIAHGLIIQVNPQHNGEIYLSKIAIDQNPLFFDFPFKGETKPKKKSNPPYPQRDPDPRVTVQLIDSTGVVGKQCVTEINMVYYDKRSEIRITIPSDKVPITYLRGLLKTGQYPIMLMQKSQVIGIDYDLAFFEFGSSEYQNLLKNCNQTLPSGGKKKPRKMGWC